ncbi:hypothetical protein OF83DRAFT_183435 [Amylostereum chailletii]|nr:hypothetical protein OF83DRAFT_183435 [Amylostereum chailletii]
MSTGRPRPSIKAPGADGVRLTIRCPHHVIRIHRQPPRAGISSSTRSMDRSIVEELTGSKNPAQELEGFPATELSKVLLYHAGFEAVKRKHNQRIVYQMVEGSRDLYYEINTVIDNVNKLDDQQEEEDYCKMFNDYQGALATLEALLFDLVDPSYDEMDHESGNLKSLLLAVEMQQTTIIKWQTYLSLSCARRRPPCALWKWKSKIWRFTSRADPVRRSTKRRQCDSVNCALNFTGPLNEAMG